MYPDINLKHLASLVVKEIKNAKGGDKLSISDLQNGDQIAMAVAKSANRGSGGFDMSDQRWHGGGDTVKAGTNITIITNTDGQKVISATGGGDQLPDYTAPDNTSIYLTGGDGILGDGGGLALTSGNGTFPDSSGGGIVLNTASGNGSGNSGDIDLTVSDASGHGGQIDISAGNGKTGGGNISVLSGSSMAEDSGSTLVTNGDFTGSASGWTLGANWGYNSNNVIHTPGDTATLFQNISVLNGEYYHLSITLGSGSGAVDITLGDDPAAVQTVYAGSSINFYLTAGVISQGNIVITPTSDFDGTVDSVVVKLTNPGSSAGNITIETGDSDVFDGGEMDIFTGSGAFGGSVEVFLKGSGSSGSVGPAGVGLDIYGGDFVSNGEGGIYIVAGSPLSSLTNNVTPGAINIQGGDSSVISDGNGGSVDISAGDGGSNSGNGGHMHFKSGNGDDGGFIVAESGIGHNGDGGEIDLFASYSDASGEQAQGGEVYLEGGEAGGNGGYVSVSAGFTNFQDGAGGDVTITGGEVSGLLSGSASSINIYGANHTNTKEGGNIEIFSGKGTDTGGGGNVNIKAGLAGVTSGNGGDIDLTAGDSASSDGNGGNLSFNAGSADDDGGNGTGGFVEIIAGDGFGVGEGGSMNLTTGTGSGNANGGNLNIVLGGGNGGGHDGRLNIAGLPTSAVGLTSGDIWNSSGTLKIV